MQQLKVEHKVEYATLKLFSVKGHIVVSFALTVLQVPIALAARRGQGGGPYLVRGFSFLFFGFTCHFDPLITR